jgi:agmatinase
MAKKPRAPAPAAHIDETNAIDDGHFDGDSTPLADSGIFGLETSAEAAQIFLLPVPWEVTTSYGKGTSNGPRAILRASRQVDLFDIETGDAWKIGYHMDEISQNWLRRNSILKEKAQERLEFIEAGEVSESSEMLKDQINAASDELNLWVEEKCGEALAQKKIVGVVGGDHSSPFGLISAISKKLNGDFGILHIDAHADLRDAYQGYKHSHASIMNNVIEKIKPRVLVQVGIRDFCREEFEFSEAHRNKSGEVGSARIVTHYDRQMKKRLFAGESFDSIAKAIVADLPKNVYVSFDIDGLDPALCPNTGTPVPGGLSFDQACSLLSILADSGKKIVGFDLNEVSEPEEGMAEWDANVGARFLFKLCGWAAVTNGLAERRS